MVIWYSLGVKGQLKTGTQIGLFVWRNFGDISLIGLIKMCTAFWTNSYTPILGLRQKQPIQCFETRLQVPSRYWPGTVKHQCGYPSKLYLKTLTSAIHQTTGFWGYGNITGIIGNHPWFGKLGIATPMLKADVALSENAKMLYRNISCLTMFDHHFSQKSMLRRCVWHFSLHLSVPSSWCGHAVVHGGI
jgi:hypothetical protein